MHWLERISLNLFLFWWLQQIDHCEWGFTRIILHPWSWCSVSKQIVSWRPGCLFSVGWILQAAVLSLNAYPVCRFWPHVPSDSLQCFLTDAAQKACLILCCFVNAIQGLLCPSSFLPQSADGLSSLSGFLYSLMMGKGFDLVSYQ